MNVYIKCNVIMCNIISSLTKKKEKDQLVIITLTAKFAKQKLTP